MSSALEDEYPCDTIEEMQIIRVDTPSAKYSVFAGTGISTDSARRKKSKSWARWTAKQCKKLFQATPMPELMSPKWEIGLAPVLGQVAFAGGEIAGPAGPFVVLPEK